MTGRKIRGTIILAAAVLLLLPSAGQPTAAQGSYAVELSETELTLDYDTVAFLDVNVTLGGTPVSGAYFSLSGIDYDIEESQLDYGNGTYRIVFSENATRQVQPGNYSVELLGSHQGSTFSEELSISIISLDSVAPQLEIISPSPQLIQNSTQFKLVLTLIDETAWLDINVTAAGEQIIYLRRVVEEYNISSTVYNTTSLYLETWVLLDQLSGVEASDLIIVGRDTSYNRAELTIPLTGDYTKPSISWNGVNDNRIEVNTRDLELSWTINDASPIVYQQLMIDGRPFLPDALTGSSREVSFTLPVAVDKSVLVVIELRVTDSSGNTNSISIEVIYNVPPAEEDGIVQQLFGSDQDQGSDLPLMISMVASLVVLIIGGGIILAKGRDPEGNGDFSRPIRKYIEKHSRSDAKQNIEVLPDHLQRLIGNWYKQLPTMDTEDAFLNELEFLLSSIDYQLQGTELDDRAKPVINLFVTELENLKKR